ncbi:MAG TPA: hypothetical protein PLV45_10165, partial [bacterium]|nr:hypothetical protein [bacterium]
EWLESLFGVSVAGGDTGSYAVSGVPGDPFYDGAEIRLKRKTGDTWYTGDEISPVNGAYTALTFTDTDPLMPGAIVRRDTGLRTIAYPFAIEHAKTDEDLQALLSPIRDFLADHPAFPEFDLTLNHQQFAPGDAFILDAGLCNPYPEPLHGEMFIALSVLGEYWFWPSWIHYPDGVDFRQVDVQPYASWDEKVLNFVWPDVSGPGPLMQFIGAAIDTDGNLLDDLIIREFSY